jgi:hypothetical protein
MAFVYRSDGDVLRMAATYQVSASRQFGLDATRLLFAPRSKVVVTRGFTALRPSAYGSRR